MFIGTRLLAGRLAQPKLKPYEINDNTLSGFTLRVQPSGVRSYYARFGRNRRVALGKDRELLPDDARSRCQKVFGNVAHGRHPLHGIDGADLLTLGRFIDETYAPRARANRPRTATNTLRKLEIHFGTWFAEPLTAITLERLELWKGRRLNSGRRPTTALRDMFALSSVRALSRGQMRQARQESDSPA